MANFNTAIVYVLDNEDPGLTGVVEHDPTSADPKALARYGINSAANPQMPEGFYNGMLPNDVAIVAAEVCYLQNYWNPMRGSDINDQRVATKLMDIEVNMGSGVGVRLVQGILSLTVDGIMGPLTLGAINASTVNLVDALVTASSVRYRRMASVDPMLAKWLPDWLIRAAKVPQ